MTTGTDYGKLYNQAYAAYGQGNYDAALALTEQMEQEFPNDAHLFLLQGNIYYGLAQYDHACQKYESVLGMEEQLRDQPQVLEYAHQGLERAQQYLAQLMDPDLAIAETESLSMASKEAKFPPDDNGFSPALNGAEEFDEEDFLDWQQEADALSQSEDFAMDEVDWDSAIFSDEELGEPTIGKAATSEGNPFDKDHGATHFNPDLSNSPTFQVANNPFESSSGAFDPEEAAADFSLSSADFGDKEQDELSFGDEDSQEYQNPSISNSAEKTFMVSGTLNPGSSTFGDSSESVSGEENRFGGTDWDDVSVMNEHTVQAPPVNFQQSEEGRNNWDNMAEQELDELSQFNLTEISEELPDSGLFSEEIKGAAPNFSLDEAKFATQTSADSDPSWIKSSSRSSGENSNISEPFVKPVVEVEQGKLAWLINAPLAKKQLITAAAAGLVSSLTVLFVAGGSALLSTKDQSPTPQASPTTEQPATDNQTTKNQKTSQKGSPILLMALLSGVGSFLVTFILLEISKRYTKRTLEDLLTQLDTLHQGNYNVKATVFGADELGSLSSRFNAVAREVHTKTSEALARATEVEQAREDLQRQVIRLLDDVEGAARGDLTVEAEVTADVLGAVADAFNLTIQNLREIVKQVKKAAKQVNKGSTDSELFARNNSGDALRMAEELAVTLNSVQMMTESIQRVAENAREAEEVAHTSSITALKGGETVEQTVAAILQIRETVSEAARKVKRLAEASQEISKIVAVISQIASRTNLLALNASIQAARAGEAGKGFAIVADEVRQLADRSAKELKDIEQIVLQIQSETGSVMKAMEEGIQQVIKLTDMSEQSKRALEDIIEVSNRINTLVRSITADTVKQRENSRAVAQVMQSVELTAQETSQESQRVAGSLQKLVSISRDLLSSVESFQVDAES